VRPEVRQFQIELGDGVICQFGQLALGLDQDVCGHHSRASGIGNNGQTSSRWHLFAADQFHHVEDLADVINPCNAGSLEGRVIDVVRGSQSSGVRGRHFCRFRKTACLVSDDGLAERERPRGGHKPASIGNRFYIEDDGFGALVFTQVVDNVAKIHVHGVADRDKV